MAGVEEEESPAPVDLDDLHGHFSIVGFLDYLGTKLRYSEKTSDKNFRVFSNEEDDESDSLQPTSTVKSKIGVALHRMVFWHIWPILAQFWALVEDEGRLVLKTSGQPFGMAYLLKGLCSYRKYCLNYSYRADEEERSCPSKGPPSRVFLTGLPEHSPSIELYSREEFPMRDDAIHRGIKSYLAVPVFEPGSHECIGVLELLGRTYDMNHWFKPGYLMRLISTALEEVELRTSDYNSHFDMENDLANSSTGLRQAFNEIQKAINMVCKRHKLPFAQTWTLSSDESNIGKTMSTTKKGSYSSDRRYSILQEACGSFQLMKGQGVVWKAFSCQNSCFCRDISQLSITDYSFAHIARILGLTSSFAICLQSNLTGDDIYVLELFLPSYKTRDPQILLGTLLATMKQHLKSFKIFSGQKIAKEVYVEVLRVSREDEVDSFVICQTPSGSLGLENLGDDDGLIQQHFSNQQSVGSIFSLEVDNSDNESGKEGRYPTSGLEVINLDVLQKYFGMKHKDAALALGVCRSTLKRKCRKYGIKSWPQKRINKNSTPANNQSIQVYENRNAEYGQEGLHLNMYAEEGTTPSFPQTLAVPNSSIMTIKAQYGEEDIIKFGLPFSSKMTDLENEVTMRLGLEVGNFKIRYRDEDDEWILLTCDKDLRTMEFMGKTTIRMSIIKC